MNTDEKKNQVLKNKFGEEHLLQDLFFHSYRAKDNFKILKLKLDFNLLNFTYRRDVEMYTLILSKHKKPIWVVELI